MRAREEKRLAPTTIESKFKLIKRLNNRARWTKGDIERMRKIGFIVHMKNNPNKISPRLHEIIKIIERDYTHEIEIVRNHTCA